MLTQIGCSDAAFKTDVALQRQTSTNRFRVTDSIRIRRRPENEDGRFLMLNPDRSTRSDEIYSGGRLRWC
jgi:hypothetical protein